MSASNEIRCKIGLEFEKEGLARFFSHHDLMRFFERALRRADLPVRLTEGFNPQPRLVFPAPLSLGIASNCEFAEIEFTDDIPPQDVRRKLEPLMPEGMSLREATGLPPVRRGRKVRRSSLEFSGFPGLDGAEETLETAARELGNSEVMEVVRLRKGRERKVDIAPSLLSVKAIGLTVVAELNHGGEVTARPDELAAYLCEPFGIDWKSLSIRRTSLVLG